MRRFAVGFLLSIRLLGQEPKHYTCYHTAGSIKIDGKLDDRAWRDALWTDWFVDIEGAKKPKPRFRTRAKLLWDEENLYVGAELEEPDIWGTLTEHDSVIFRDNDLEVFLKPRSDNPGYFEFEINALNTSWDLFLNKRYLDKGKADNTWDIPGLRTAVAVNGTLNHPGDRDHGWSLEIAFPWAAFASRIETATPKAGDEWRFNFSRVEWQTTVADGRYVKKRGLREDNWVWSPQGAVNMHLPDRWGFLRFERARN